MWLKLSFGFLLIVVAIYGIFVVGGAALLSVMGAALQDVSFEWYWGTVWNVLLIPSVVVWVIAYVLGLRILFREVNKRDEEEEVGIEEGEDTAAPNPQDETDT